MIFKNESKKQKEIIFNIQNHLNIKNSISFYDSSLEKGLQCADCVAGTIRRFLKNEKNIGSTYNLIKDKLLCVENKKG